ncbi:hypothetical protein A9P82_12345 [Arachidicoccus ginsenosidimutans]|uniref:hypothetical protein n=1 Tax=Arachidicoccus sp. BS20 TaxID=1850526 RepID=UPI0007F098D7|nr:hypothetical protein [Arachidicoccus sp. BS20]ANI90002.1 hypothetical protein A9P82_12345 [Arachidicoccus sp. BS20]
MANTITIYPNSKEEESLYKQLAKRLNNHFTSDKKKLSDANIRFLKELEQAVQELNAIKSGKAKGREAKALIDEL